MNADVRRWLTREPLTKHHLAVLSGLSPRDVEAQINALRHDGAAIASDGRGYWLPQSAAEYAANVERRRVRALRQLLTVRAERRTVRAMEREEAGPLAFRWEEVA